MAEVGAPPCGSRNHRKDTGACRDRIPELLKHRLETTRRAEGVGESRDAKLATYIEQQQDKAPESEGAAASGAALGSGLCLRREERTHRGHFEAHRGKVQDEGRPDRPRGSRRRHIYEGDNPHADKQVVITPTVRESRKTRKKEDENVLRWRGGGGGRRAMARRSTALAEGPTLRPVPGKPVQTEGGLRARANQRVTPQTKMSLEGLRYWQKKSPGTGPRSQILGSRPAGHPRCR